MLELKIIMGGRGPVAVSLVGRAAGPGTGERPRASLLGPIRRLGSQTLGVGRHTRAGSPGRVPPVGESREPLDDRISRRRRLRHLAAAGFEALRSVLLLGLRARASGLDELLGAELALHRSLGDVHLVGLAIEAGRLGRQLGGLVVVGGLASLGLGEEVVHGDGAAHGPRLSTVWGSPARGFSLWGSRGVPPVPSRVARRRQTSRHFPRRAGWTNQQDLSKQRTGPAVWAVWAAVWNC